MVKDPYFILDGVSRFDVRQGGIIGKLMHIIGTRLLIDHHPGIHNNEIYYKGI